MRRHDREVTDPLEICEMLRRCDTLRLGICDGMVPYVVPVSFGLEVNGGDVTVYFHGAKLGHKAALLKSSPLVRFEGDRFLGVERVGNSVTTRYESVIGEGLCEAVRGKEAAQGLRSVLEHYGYGDFPLETCSDMEAVAVYKITVDHMTGKRNLPKGE